MQFLLILVALAFSAALVLYALPIILYVAPVFVVGIIISLIADSIRHKSKAVAH